MTTKEPRKYEKREITKWEDLTPGQRTGVRSELSRVGNNSKSGMTKAIATADDLSVNAKNESQRKLETSKAASLRLIEPKVKDKPVSMQGATGRRVEHFTNAAAKARESGEGLAGAGWYFEHHGEVMAGAQGRPVPEMAAATAALSPGKNPKTDELPAIHALVELHSNPHTITDTKRRGSLRTRNAEDISSEEIGVLGSRAKNEHAHGKKPTVISTTGADVGTAGRGHQASTVKATKALRHETEPDDVNDPRSGPKTASYARGIRDSVPGSAEHLDYMGIAHHAVHGSSDQGMIQFSRESNDTPLSHDSPLSPEHHTAEDTWMQAISSGQQMAHVGESVRSPSPAKRVVGTTADPNKIRKVPEKGDRLPTDVTSTGATHAFNNKATRQAAHNVGAVGVNQHGEDIHIPSIMMQEVAWTEARRVAGGDADYNRQRAAENKTPTIKGPKHTQGSLF